MRTALCLGGANTLHEDIAALPVPYDGVVACNEAGADWPGELDAWVTLHPGKMRPWQEIRRRNGYPNAKLTVSHRDHSHGPKMGLVTEYKFPGQSRSGSSGLFVVKVAMIDLGFDRAVLCGIPLTKAPHFFDKKDWRAAEGFRNGFLEVPAEYRCRMRSMSGWTRALLGHPRDWLE